MSPKKPPPSLHSLCRDLLSGQLINALSDEEGKHFDDVKRYMSCATYDILQALMNGILGHINLDASTRYSCLQALLREDVKNLEVGIFPLYYYDKILASIRDQGKGLQHLNMKGVWARDYPEMLSKLILNLSHLKTLIVPHMADDSVINSVLSLKNLVKLDISGEACYSIQGIRTLKSETIRILDIGSFGKPDLCQDTRSSYELVAEVIQNLPNLNVIKTYSFTGHALWHLYIKDNSFKTKLTYLHTTESNKEILNAIVITCPYLENAHVNCPEGNVLEELCAVRNLHSLKLTRGDVLELKTFLQKSGQQLQILKLNHNKNLSIYLSELCEYAPYLSTLECFHMFLTYTNLNSFYMALQKVQILYCDISDGVIKTILTNAPFLRSVTVGCSLEMTDGDMFRLLGECTLENLEELLLSEAKFLTAVTVQLLAENCPNLRILGSLMGWDITQEEIDALRLLLGLSNTDLVLWPVT